MKGDDLGSTLDLPAFRLALAETIQWCRERADLVVPATGLRSAELAPAARDKPGELVAAQIDAVVERRRQLLPSPQTECDDLAGGRLLIYEPDNNLADGAAEVYSGGFFDSDNRPPWDTWLGYVYGIWTNTTTRAEYRHLYLVSWVPPAFLKLVDEGIWANPEQCIRWAVDEEHAFLRQLDGVGLLA